MFDALDGQIPGGYFRSAFKNKYNKFPDKGDIISLPFSPLVQYVVSYSGTFTLDVERLEE